MDFESSDLYGEDRGACVCVCVGESAFEEEEASYRLPSSWRGMG